MQLIIRRWVKVALVNLCIVALLGVVLRYKIAFSLPFIDQRNLHHGHSHFAFSGWITQTILILLVYYLHQKGQKNLCKRYVWILFSNLIVSYGMLISFPIQGYAFFSILFSTLTIFVSYIFAILFWKDLNKLNLNRNSHLWFKAALLFNIISSIGPFYLAYMMSGHIINQKAYLVSEFIFLHFQYNGWFLFSCIGLFISKLHELIGEKKQFGTIFWIFALSCIPSFFLSVLWIPVPKPIYALIVIAAAAQLIAWGWVIKTVRNHISTLRKEIPNQAKWLMALAAISLSIKLMLQLGSAYLPLNQLVFGFRPIVIGYLHLVFLAVISVFLLGYILFEKLIVINRIVTIGLLIFVLGIFINELFLMIQGISALNNTSIPSINLLLFVAAIIMFTGVLLINVKQYPPRLPIPKK